MSPPFPSPPSPPSFFFSSHSLSGRAASEGPIPQGTAPAETGSGSSYNSEWIANHQGLRWHPGAAFPPQPRAQVTGDMMPRWFFGRAPSQPCSAAGAAAAPAGPVTCAGEDLGLEQVRAEV